MRNEGYEEGYATALTAASGTIGVIIPPSIPKPIQFFLSEWGLFNFSLH
jgi:C4-dicarboxylate transporter DctM subunit